MGRVDPISQITKVMGTSTTAISLRNRKGLRLFQCVLLGFSCRINKASLGKRNHPLVPSIKLVWGV